VIAFDPPADFHSYAQYKVKAKSQKSSHFLILSDVDGTDDLVGHLAVYRVTEERLKARCTLRGPSFEDVAAADQVSILLIVNLVKSFRTYFYPNILGQISIWNNSKKMYLAFL
jgi:hypothetical protein